MIKLIFMVFILTLTSQMYVNAQEADDMSKGYSNFMEEFKQEIAEKNLIDTATVQELNALAEKMNQENAEESNFEITKDEY